MALAIVAAALADPIVEFGSNAGWFGPGTLTDHSNLDVGPALLLGVGLLALFMVRKARAVLAGTALPRRSMLLLPSIFALQMPALYGMETLEQVVTRGHALGAAAWLGGPWPVSLTVHGIVCAVVALVVLQSRRTLAATTLRMLRLISEISRAGRRPLPLRRASFAGLSCKELMPVLCTIGERAPPR